MEKGMRQNIEALLTTRFSRYMVIENVIDHALHISIPKLERSQEINIKRDLENLTSVDVLVELYYLPWWKNGFIKKVGVTSCLRKLHT